MPMSERPKQKALGASFWEKQVKSYTTSGLSQGEFCSRNRLKLSAFGYWYRKLKHHTPGKIIKAKNTTCCQSDVIKISNIVSTRNQSHSPAHTCLEMELRNGWKINIPAGWNIESLKQLLAFLKEEVCS